MLTDLMARTHACVICTVVCLLVPVPVSAGCEDSYPDTRVEAALADPDYLECDIVTMRTDYVEHLREQGILLQSLEPAYEASLQSQGLTEQDASVRFEDFASKIGRLSSLAASTTPELVTATIPPESADAVGEWFEESDRIAKKLKNRMVGVDTDLTVEEREAYCRLDFSFTVRERLHEMLMICLEAD